MNYVKLLRIETKDGIELDIPFDTLRIGKHIISVIKNGIGLMSNNLQAANVIGITRITVVTLSKKADATAVNIASATKTSFGLPLVFFKISLASQVNMPD